MSIHRYNYPTAVTFGPGASEQIPTALLAANLQRPLVIADRNVAALPFFEKLVAQISATNGLDVATFTDFGGNPVKSQVTAGVAAARTHNTDTIIAVGGGCPMDVARAISLMLHHPGDLFDYEDGKPGAPPVDKEIPYLITVPTTAGTGSEVGRSAVISDDETHAKKIIFNPRLMPQQVFADPILTLGMPPHITAATGFDALTHCIEAYLANGHHPMADGIALAGVRLVAKSLERAVNNGADLDARSDMLSAAMMGGTSFQKGLGAVHSCAHALSTVHDTHHGLANAILLPYVMRFNQIAAPQRLADLAIAARCGHTAEAFIAWIVDLQKRTNIPPNISAVGVTTQSIETLTPIAFADPCHGMNPRPCTAEDLRGIYLSAL